jgi:hypothetical protein
VRITDLARDLTLDRILGTMLDANRPADLAPEHLTPPSCDSG